MVVSGHTHNAYNCMLPNAAARNIPVTSASSFGRLVTDIDMKIDTETPTSRRQISVNNVIVTRDRAEGSRGNGAHRQVQRPPSRRSRTRSSARSRHDITRTNNAAGESALGDVIGDAQLAYTQSAGQPSSRS